MTHDGSDCDFEWHPTLEDLFTTAASKGHLALCCLAICQFPDESVLARAFYVRVEVAAAAHREDALRRFCEMVPDDIEVIEIVAFERLFDLPPFMCTDCFRTTVRRHQHAVWAGPLFVRSN